MRRLLAACLLLPLLAAPASAAPAVGARALWRENRLLAAEADFAQKPKSYFVLNLEERRVAVKARGMVLREMPFEQVGVWGRRLPIGPAVLLGKDSLAQPARPQIRPGEEKALESLDEQILEVKGMPTRYHLTFDRNVVVEVLPAAPAGFWPQFRQRLELWRWHLLRPLQTLRERRVRRESTSLYLVMQPEEARALYWSLYEGIEGVVVPP